MEQIYLKARAKVNLILNVLNKREDNYHNLESIFQKISLYDELYVQKINEDKIILETNISELNNDNNIICKAYKLLKNMYKNITGVKVKLNKKIPMQAGLAGGSTDCSSFIIAMNKIFELKLSEKEFVDIGKVLGADVVPCYYNKSVKAEGIGEIITQINTNAKYYILIIKPYISYSTKTMFQKLDEKERNVNSYDLKKMVNALENNNIGIIANNLYNAFEEVIDEKELIENLKNELLQNGAIRKFNGRFRLMCFWDF